ncbi:MAG: KOW domain-containing RNA-binding protein [Clostridia bacterium]|nr:KOW domain-containing RNA-binding protein [Clostridia bacterium]
MLECGCVVRSLSGHDAGGCFVVLRCGNGFAYVCDGARRRFECPKRKNAKHLKLLDVQKVQSAQCDAHVRRALKSIGAVRTRGYFRLKEEGCFV